MIVPELLSARTIRVYVDVNVGIPGLNVPVDGGGSRVVLMININIHVVVVVVVIMGASAVEAVPLGMVVFESINPAARSTVHIDIDRGGQGSLQSASEKKLLEQHFQNVKTSDWEKNSECG